MVTYEGKMIIFGGWDGTQVRNEVYEYSPDQDEWNDLSPMPSARSMAGAAIVGGKIFVFGGFDGNQAVSINQVYNPTNETSGEPTWQSADPMPSPRYGMGVASLADIIHVVGGIGEDDTPLPSLQFQSQILKWEIYDDPLIGSWSAMGMGATTTHIYVIGGELNGVPTDENISYQAVYLINLPVIR
jgi:hypothetical protein